MHAATIPFMRPHTSTGLRIERHNTKEGARVFNTVKWGGRTASISSGDGSSVFEQTDVEAPESWSDLAVKVVASKYFRGHVGSKDRESSVWSLISRVADTITEWGQADGYFRSDEDAEIFCDELAYLLLHQRYAFNSPVWFNVGVESDPQCSACFINSVEDSMESILELAATEARLFKGGSGAGANLSSLRSSKERLRGGGIASGPVSFMKGFDAFAGAIKSGGKTRRAAKIVILDVDHPDIMEFITCKAGEERKAWALAEAGYDPSLTGEAYASVAFQNANHSIRVSNDFMRAAEAGDEVSLKAITTGEVLKRVNAKELIMAAAEATHLCGDPGIQFDDTINEWHTCKTTGRINASNPCSEFMFIDDSACNLGSLNLLTFLKEDGSFDAVAFEHAVQIAITAQEILVDSASYPTAEIAENSTRFRPLGLGYANLGALLMSLGVPYDSDDGRAIAAAITSLMSAQAYAQSACIAKERGAFQDYVENRQSFLEVIERHADESMHQGSMHRSAFLDPIFGAATTAWVSALSLGNAHGFRNAQVTLLAPTGTIAFMMDCDTTGIEPDTALMKTKQLVGGGSVQMLNRTVPRALKQLRYDDLDRYEILAHLESQGGIEGAPHLKAEHLPVFDCALRALGGERVISPVGHIAMMAAVQPFLSGAISKTVNVPEETTAEQIFQIYLDAWSNGLKSIAIYRDGSKKAQPISTVADKEDAELEQATRPARRPLPNERAAITHKFSVAGNEGYLTIGLYDDGTPGELFITMSKEGSTISGLMDTIATSISLALQYGVPLSVLVTKFSHMRFEPSGYTGNPEIPIAKSIVDYIFRWFGLKFGLSEELVDSTISQKAEAAVQRVLNSPQMVLPMETTAAEEEVYRTQSDAPPCTECGSITVRAGACYTCTNCGASTGCG